MSRRLAVAVVAAALGAAILPPSDARADLVRVPWVLAEGDAVTDVATHFHVSMEDLAELNEGVDLATVGPGSELTVGFGERIEHVVVRGDTLRRLARRHGVTVDDIVRWNAIADPSRIRAGQTLVLYARPRLPPSSSVGRAYDGSLERGVAMRSGPYWAIHEPRHAFVTRDVLGWMREGFAAVHAHHAGSPRVEVRDASAEHGGHLAAHHSHQSGRDIDLVYFQTHCDELCRHHRVGPSSLDAARTWTLLEAWLRRGVVEYVFVDHALQEPLYEAARAAGVSRAQLSHWFQWPRASTDRMGIIRHVDGHRDHMHVRFVCAAHDLRCEGSAQDDQEAEGDDPHHS